MSLVNGIELYHVLPCYYERLLAKTSHLSAAEFGAYWRLLLHQWQKGAAPVGDSKRLSQIMGCAAKTVWPAIEGFFECQEDGRWQNRRLEEVRIEQARIIRRNAKNGAKGGRPQKPKPDPNSEPKPEAKPNPGKSFLDPSTQIRTPSVPINGSDQGRALPVLTSHARATSAAGMSPGAWGNKHSDHLAGFCDWLCFPDDLAKQFAQRLSPHDPEDGLSQVRIWATQVRRSWEANGATPSGRMYDFWNYRWAEEHGEVKPETTGVAGRHARTKQRLDDFVENG